MHDDKKVELICTVCKKSFSLLKKDYLQRFRLNPHNRNNCSNECRHINKIKKIQVNCKNCNIIFSKLPNQIKKTKNNNFCSKSCAATYNNTHKTTGIRRSKLEIWLEQKLSSIYPDLEILYCNKTMINSELDIYIPSLKIAFELNGIFHYEPIYGQDKLDQIRNNDNRKFQACLEQKISLAIIDSSSLKYFKEQNCQKYLDIIKNIINRASDRI